MERLALALLLITSGASGNCNLQLKGMLKSFDGENYENVEYVFPEDLHKYRVTVQDGLLYNYKKKKVNTKSFWGDRPAIFVVDEKGYIYMSTWFKEGYFHHSSFLRGKPVAMAGTIMVHKGRIVMIDNHSGHYEPTPEMFKRMLLYLRELGVDLKSTDIRVKK